MILLKNCNIDDSIKDLLINDTKIQSIGVFDEKNLKKIFGKQIEIIDLKNKNVIPGYIDNHVHVTGGGGEKGFTSRAPEIKFSDIISSGVTTVVGVLGTDSVTRSIENLLSKTKALNEEGITAYCLTGSYEYPSPTITGSVQKDITFINEILGVKMAISDHRCYNPTKEELIKLMSEIRVAGLISGKQSSVNYHIGWGKGNMDVLLGILDETNIPATVIRPTHITCNEDVFNQSLELAKRGSYIDITAGEDVSKSVEYIRKIFDNGLDDKLTISSDANGSVPIWKNNECIGFGIHTMKGLHEIVRELVQKYNFKLSEATKLLTSNPANALGLKYKGKISVGFDADLIVLDDNYDIDTVISLGKVVFKNKKVINRGIYE